MEAIRIPLPVLWSMLRAAVFAFLHWLERVVCSIVWFANFRSGEGDPFRSCGCCQCGRFRFGGSSKNSAVFEVLPVCRSGGGGSCSCEVGRGPRSLRLPEAKHEIEGIQGGAGLLIKNSPVGDNTPAGLSLCPERVRAYSVLVSAAGASAASCCTAVVAIVAATLAAVVAASVVAALI